MIDTPQELYDAIAAFKPDASSTICLLHKPCKGHPLCSFPSSYEVIDFDAVEDELARGKRSKRPSCDGVTLNEGKTIFCFLEIKGWKKYVEFNINNEGASLSADEVQMIYDKAAGYNFKEKLDHSMADCEKIAGQSELFLRLPYVYIIVSDIEEEINAIGDIAVNLSSLANSSTVWRICDESTKAQLDKLDVTVRKVYTHCREFDLCITSIHIVS